MAPVTVLLVLVGWLAGLLLGRGARKEEAGAPLAMATAVLFGAITLAPAGLSLFVLSPDWSLMYAIHPEHVPFWPLGAAIGLALVAVSAGGCALALGSPRLSGVLALLSAAVLVSLVVLGWPRLSVVAYYETMHYGVGRGHLLAQSAIFVPAVVSAAAVVGVYVFSYLHLRRQV